MVFLLLLIKNSWIKFVVMAQGMVFEDIFNVKDMDPNGKQFDRGKSLNYKMKRIHYLT